MPGGRALAPCSVVPLRSATVSKRQLEVWNPTSAPRPHLPPVTARAQVTRYLATVQKHHYRGMLQRIVAYPCSCTFCCHRKISGHNVRNILHNVTLGSYIGASPQALCWFVPLFAVGGRHPANLPPASSVACDFPAPRRYAVCMHIICTFTLCKCHWPVRWQQRGYATYVLARQGSDQVWR